MWLLICLFFPSLIALGVHKNLFEVKEKIDYFVIYAFYNVLINFLICLICYIRGSYIYDLFDSNLFTINFSVKYLGIALFFSYFIPHVIFFFKNNVTITIRRKNNEKKKSKKD